jgi:predicted transcriptional regulator
MINMVMTQLYEDDGERSQHSFAIQSLAKDLGVSQDEIHQYYEEALRDLKTGARIKVFLSVLASRRVRETLLEKINDTRRAAKRG